MKSILRILVLFLFFGFVINSELIRHENESINEITCLAKTIYYEARGDTFNGQVAVANVVKNRFRTGKYPSLCSVVTEKNQFPWYKKQYTIVEKKAWEKDFKIAIDIFKGKIPDNTLGAVFFHEPKIHPKWAKKENKIGQIGAHIFYRDTPIDY